LCCSTSSPEAGSILLSGRLSSDAPLLLVALAAGLYLWGARRERTPAWRTAVGAERLARSRRHAFAFAAGLATVALALGEPLDGLAEKLFWAHMVQHVLLLVVAAPLIVLGAPWMRLWRALPLRGRRPLARAIARDRRLAPLRWLALALGTPAVAWLALNADIVAWHVPAAYDLTLRSDAAHYFEHATFLALGVLAWAQVIDTEPFHSRLALPGRAVFAFGSMLVGWLLALGLAFSGKAWYAAYAGLRSRPGHISALADQQLAAGVMWVPASLPWAVAIFVLIYMWVADRQPLTPHASRRAHA
jgi:putative membrane protein